MTLLELSVSEAPSCGIILTTRSVIYEYGIFIIHATRVIIYSKCFTHNDFHIYCSMGFSGSKGVEHNSSISFARLPDEGRVLALE
jgi:hypothetical protein